MKPSIVSHSMRLATLALLAGPLSADAAVITAAFTITARYQQTCNIVTVPVLDFGTITSNAADVTMSATMVLNCSSGSATPFGVWAPLSANANGTQRRMKLSYSSTNSYLNYTVQMGPTGSTTLPTTFTSTGFTTGVGASGGNSGSGSDDYGIVLRATVPAGQTLTQGYYVDDLVLTVSY